MVKINFSKKSLLSALKSFFTKNITVKIAALFFAMILWGYVLADLDPYRLKNVANVITSFSGEADLLAQGLCVRGDRDEILNNVSVGVRTRITNYSNLTASSVTASINLKNISRPGEYKLPINASVTSALGYVDQVSPSSVTVVIDSLVSKTVPVTCSFIGELPEGYWADMNNLSSTTRIDVEGARSDISKISRAECKIDLTDRTSTIFGTFDLVFYDFDGNELNSDIIIGTLPSSTIRLPVYSMKTVPVDAESALIGTDNLAANYELSSVVVTPQTIRIIGSYDAVSAVEAISVEPFSVSGLKESTIYESDFVLPEGIKVIDDYKTASIALDIREMTDSQEYVQLPVGYIGLEKGSSAKVEPEDIDLMVSGRISLVSLLKRKDIDVYVDLTGLTAGTYQLPVSVFVKDDETTVELTLELSKNTVDVEITDAE